jgi:hypothetical protein
MNIYSVAFVNKKCSFCNKKVVTAKKNVTSENKIAYVNKNAVKKRIKWNLAPPFLPLVVLDWSSLSTLVVLGTCELRLPASPFLPLVVLDWSSLSTLVALGRAAASSWLLNEKRRY